MAENIYNTDEYQKLLKKYRSLEKELEDYEEDLDKAEKKIKDLKSDVSSLEEKLDRSESEKAKHLQESENTIEQNRFLQKESDIKSSALQFVTEILTADHKKDASDSKLEKDVDEVVAFLRGEVRDTLKNTHLLNSELENRFFGSELDSWAIYQKKSWIKGKISIAFVGEFSAGKTSIVNNILSGDKVDGSVPLLPVSTKATTAIPTYISGGDCSVYCFVTPDNELKDLQEKTFKKVSKEILDQVKGVSSLIQYFVMKYKNPNLESLSILDTPGFNSNDGEDRKRTIEVINECDALFWVMDVNSGSPNSSSLKEIKDNLKKPLYIIINKIDTKPSSEVNRVKELCEETFNRAEVAFKEIILFSKKEPWRKITNLISKVPHDTSRESLLDDLVEYIEKSSKNLEQKAKQLSGEYSRIEKEYYRSEVEFKAELRVLNTYCDKLSNIPQYNSRWFDEDDYRMSKSEYEAFEKLIDAIRESGVEEIPDMHDNIVSKFEELKESWEKKFEANQRIKDVDEVLSKIKRYVKTLHQHSRISNVDVKPKYTSTSTNTYNGSQSSDKPLSYQFLLNSTSEGKTISQILAPFIKDRRERNEVGLPLPQIKIAWMELLRFINEEMGYNISEKEMREGVPEFGMTSYIDSYKIRSGVEKLLSFPMFKDELYACCIGPINSGNIRKSDIDWDKFLYLLKQRHGIDMKQWQFFSGSDIAGTSLWNIIKNILDKGSSQDLIIYYKAKNRAESIPNSVTSTSAPKQAPSYNSLFGSRNSSYSSSYSSTQSANYGTKGASQAPNLSVDTFKSIFRLAIKNERGNRVLFDWDKVLEIVNRSTGRQYSKNKLRELVPNFGRKDHVNLSAVAKQIGEIMSM